MRHIEKIFNPQTQRKYRVQGNKTFEIFLLKDRIFVKVFMKKKGETSGSFGLHV